MSGTTGDTEAKRYGKFKVALFLIGGVVVAAMLAAGLVLVVLKEPLDEKAEAEATTKRILAEVDKVYLAPPGDRPTVAAIENKDKLPDQDFFNRAEEGDYLIVYPGTQFAVLYRDSIDKIIHAGAVNLPDDGDNK